MIPETCRKSINMIFVLIIYYINKSTLNEGAVEPFDIIAIWIENEDFIAGDRYGQKKCCTNGDRQSDCAQPEANSINGSLIFV